MERGGDVERRVLKQVEINNGSIPAAIQNAPQLMPGLESHYRAFMDLCSCRPPSFSGIMPIPYTAVSEYARRNGMDDDEFQILLTFIRHLDNVYSTFVESKKPRK